LQGYITKFSAAEMVKPIKPTAAFLGCPRFSRSLRGDLADLAFLWRPYFLVVASLFCGGLAFSWRPRFPRFLVATSQTSLCYGDLADLALLWRPHFFVAASLSSLSCGDLADLAFLWRPPFIVAASFYCGGLAASLCCSGLFHCCLDDA
jgi:hypothetical protein